MSYLLVGPSPVSVRLMRKRPHDRFTEASDPVPELPADILLHNHLRNTLPTQGLTAHELVFPQPGDSVESPRRQQDHGGRDQTGCVHRQTDPLDGAHHQVYGGAHVIRREAADEAVKLFRRRADS